jgi:hypothetical protein
MKKYICRERIDEKRTRIKIICKEGSVRTGIKHIGVAHNEEELKTLLAFAQYKIRDKNQLELNFEEFEKEKQQDQ